MLHLDAPGNRATQAVGHSGAPCAEHQAHEQAERELLRQSDPSGLGREAGTVDDLDLPHRDGLGDPGLLVFGSQLIRDLRALSTRSVSRASSASCCRFPARRARKSLIAAMRPSRDAMAP